MRIDVITLGCSKNLIDSERLMRRLEAKGHSLRHDPENPEADIVVVNTCGFIGDAKEESINMLLQLANLKEQGIIGKIAVMGCLSERYRDTLEKEIPEVDLWYGKFDWKGFIDDLPDESVNEEPKPWERKLTTGPANAYIKISEGCNRRCAFCAIPLITGPHKSRPIEEILEEVTLLVSKGIKEFNIIAQDLSSYGLDLYKEHKLPELIDRMADIPGVEWIRLHYAYPADFPYGILDVMARRENVAKYLDIALQHISDSVLRNMRRHIDKKETLKLLDEIRAKVPGIKLRTTLMVGFPGETEKEFEELMDFVRQQRFDRMGAFAYCEEEDTWGAKNLEDAIPEEEKKRRLDLLMALQEEIAIENNTAMIGEKIKMMVDRVEEDGTRVGRSQWDSPEVDQEIFVKDSNANPGDFIMVEITGAEEFDLYAKPL